MFVSLENCEPEISKLVLYIICLLQTIKQKLCRFSYGNAFLMNVLDCLRNTEYQSLYQNHPVVSSERLHQISELRT